MAQLYRHKQFRLYTDVRVVDGKVRFSGGKTTDQMYFLRDKNGATVDVALDYFTFLILVRNLKKFGSEANAIKRFWSFLEGNQKRKRTKILKSRTISLKRDIKKLEAESEVLTSENERLQTEFDKLSFEFKLVVRKKKNFRVN
ncbi:hypothetical protein [Idiomarina sp.]|uniref:hypothetical protein n=1 Tax=Idiomarina sp. TaxID=1874361 RepID=UPI003A94768E